MIIKPVIRFLHPHLCRAVSTLRYNRNPPKMMSDRIVWVDLEMTGLNIEKDTILEIACCITDFSLKDVIEGPNIAIKTSDKALEAMDEWCVNQHGKSGLTDLCRQSHVTLPQAEEAVLSFVREHVQPGVAPLAGNSVYLDRLFLMKHMPLLNGHLHHRIIDVSSMKEVVVRWAPHIAKSAPPKSYSHRALSDILSSISELRHYGVSIFDLA